MEELEGNIISLVDEEGNEVEFDLLMSFDYEKHRYIALLPMQKVENVGEDEVLLLEVVKKDGEEVYQPIESPILLDEVFEEFSRLFEEELDEADKEDEKE